MRVLPLTWHDDGTTLSATSYAIAGREAAVSGTPEGSPFPSFVATTHRMRRATIVLAWIGFGYAAFSALVTLIVYGFNFSRDCELGDCEAAISDPGVLTAANVIFITGMVVGPVCVAAAAAIYGLLLGRFSQIADTHMSPRLEGGDPAGTLANRTDRVANARRVLLRHDRRALVAVAIAAVAAALAALFDYIADTQFADRACGAAAASVDCLSWANRGGSFAVVFGAITVLCVGYVIYSVITRLPLRRRVQRYQREQEAERA